MNNTDPSGARLPADAYLDEPQVRELHAVLTAQLHDLLESGRKTVDAVTEIQANDPDHLDLAVTESNREWTLRLADRERRLLSKIRKALQRMQEGEYGACESCGEPIGYQRLLARPVAELCIDCKTEAEQLETRQRVF